MKRPTTIAELLGPNPPSNWGKWGPDDEADAVPTHADEVTPSCLALLRAQRLPDHDRVDWSSRGAGYLQWGRGVQEVPAVVGRTGGREVV